MNSLPLLLPSLLLVSLLARVRSHARLMEPPSRASMWRLGYDNPPDFNDHQGFCGGFKHQFGRMGGRCGICGDPADAWPRQHEAPGGRFANGIITRQYKPGQDIVVKIDVTANHKGYFTFKLCANNGIRTESEVLGKFSTFNFDRHTERPRPVLF